MPAGSGDLAGVSFTPAIDGVVAMLCTFKCAGIRSIGGSALARLFLEAGGVRNWGPYEVMFMRTDASYESLAFAIQARFVVSAGVPVYCGLWGEVTPGAAASWSDIDVTPALHTRGA